AQKLETHTGIFPENPEIEYHYLWGAPGVIGPRQDFSATQSWDFPTVYGLKKKIASSQNQQIDLNYKMKRLEILAKTKANCISLIYLNAMNRELQQRLDHALEISEAYNKRFDQGDANILEKNKAALNLLNAKNELEKNNTEKTALLSELSMLNGGMPVSFSETEFTPEELPEDFKDWFRQIEDKIPVLVQSQNEIQINEKEIRLSKAESLPKISTGYMSESVTGESFKGITLGFSIPLCENKNTVNLARARKTASENAAADNRIVYYNHLKIQFEKAKNLQKIISDYKKTLPSINNAELLKKALDAGQISLIDYMLELSLYYDTVDKIMATKRDYYQTVAELYYFGNQ
ncbi:MAG: TolC family protein, partial [Prolixibacteraceae bacterium]|nr:TolC family protein [Prolixibacteraceae bacterium]